VRHDEVKKHRAAAAEKEADKDKMPDEQNTEADIDTDRPNG
jgi:hypothetical protein